MKAPCLECAASREARIASLEQQLATAQRERDTAVDLFAKAADELMPLRREHPWFRAFLAMKKGPTT